MANILDEIAQAKREEVEAAKASRPLRDLKSAIRDTGPARDFYGALATEPARGVHLIAEIKKKSPSAGLIRQDFDPVAIAKAYRDHSATCLSVLTDRAYFDGRLEYIDQVKAAVELPVLRKDFMVDEYQIYESRAAGADCVLLIGEVLGLAQVHNMLYLACDLGMTSLIEVHEARTLAGLQGVIGFPNNKRSLLGINNRNLKTQETDLSTSETLAPMTGEGTIVVSESGVKTRADVERLKVAGARGLLIGETLMRADDIGAKIEELFWEL